MLNRHLSLRGFDRVGTAEILVQVLTQAGIAGKATVTDRRSHRFIKGIRLLAAWTWTIATGLAGPPPPATVPYAAAGGEPAWTSVCPVCRAGRLDTATGQRLFGVDETESLTCMSCGARFVPDSGMFRLVAIVHRDSPIREF